MTASILNYLCTLELKKQYKKAWKSSKNQGIKAAFQKIKVNVKERFH